MLLPDPLHTLWHTPVGVHQWPQADAANEVLVRVFQTMRATDAAAQPLPGQAAKPFYASRDDLLQRIRLTEWEQLVGFLVDSVRQTVVLANQGAWPEGKPGFQIALRGIWFQISSPVSYTHLRAHET